MNPKDSLEKHFRITPFQKKALSKLGITTIENLLRHFPSRYGEAAPSKNISGLTKGESAVIYAAVGKAKTSKAFRKRIAMAEATLEDESGKIKAVWFNQPYIAKMFPQGTLVRAEGKVSERRGELYFSNPKIERVEKIPEVSDESLFGKDSADHLHPTYPETRGVSSNWFYHHITRALRSGALESLVEPLPAEILKKYNLPSLKTAFVWIHSPKTEADAVAARKRFAFEEVFYIQLEKNSLRLAAESEEGFVINDERETLSQFLSHFPFSPTGAQNRAIESILADFKRGAPMARLLEGDVGSGKTLVAAAASFVVCNSRPNGKDFGNLQTAYLAPTEILARQQFESFIKFFEGTGVSVGLITGKGCLKFPSKVSPSSWTDISRSQLLKWVGNGEIPILVGTHALIQKTVRFKHLALVVIDEQHRFGTNQRKAMVRRSPQESPQIEAEEKKADEFLYKDLSYAIRNIAFDIQNELGSGHKESVYQNAMAEELKKRGIDFSREVKIDVKYQNKKVGLYQPDFVVQDKIIVEIKALPFTGPREKKQLWNYIKGSQYRLALLINFGTEKVEIIRTVYDTARDARQSAGPVRKSAGAVPHLLSMTATPIPRTLALTVYGDLDLTLLDELPPGRRIPITEIVVPDERSEVYEKIRAQIAGGRQAYVICPRIDEPDPAKELALLAKSVKAEAARLSREIFPEFSVGILHSKMKPDEKEKVMDDFKNRKIKILVATSVVEVGVNVPNATVILIEGAERFGLAQLHQLRGRILRSTHQAYCFVFAETRSKTSVSRLEALVKAKNGFELAEYDLKFRGAGELYGRSQWGITDVGMEALKNIKMVEAAREEARAILESDRDLSAFGALRDKLAQKEALHFE